MCPKLVRTIANSKTKSSFKLESTSKTKYENKKSCVLLEKALNEQLDVACACSKKIYYLAIDRFSH